MFPRRLILVAILSLFLQAQGADKYTDENRPYEFGFSIDGQDGEREQHRHEKKDERGLIEGEYGFITADGVYHVTVYATDENGNFKILSMKNIRVKPYPGTGGEKKGHSIPFPPSKQVPVMQGPAKPQQNVVEQSPAAPIKSCSHCSIPTPKPPPPQPQLTDIAVVSKDNPAYNSVQSSGNPQQNNNYPQQNQPNYPGQDYPQQGGPQQYPGQQNYQQPGQQNYPQQGQQNYPQPGQQNYPQQGQQNYSPGQQSYPQQDQQSYSPGQDYPAGQQNYNPGQENYPSGGAAPQYPGQGQQGERNPKQYEPGQQEKPQLIYAQMQLVDKDTDIYRRGPGEKEGLPNGLTKQDMKQLLYTFNYTLAFHAHHEEGYTDGTKVGYYYVTGRNGVKTRVDYVADEKGFRPKISQEVLDLLSEDVPKEETEKDAKYGLKGYEFKWLYYPVDSKKR